MTADKQASIKASYERLLFEDFEFSIAHDIEQVAPGISFQAYGIKPVLLGLCLGLCF